MQSSPETVDLTPLPHAYRAAFLDRQAANEALRAQVEVPAGTNRRLEHLVSELRRFIYGKKSEKLDVDDRQLAFEDLEGAVAAVEEAAPPTTPSAPAPAHLIEGGLPTEGTLPPGARFQLCGTGSCHREISISARCRTANATRCALAPAHGSLHQAADFRSQGRHSRAKARVFAIGNVQMSLGNWAGNASNFSQNPKDSSTQPAGQTRFRIRTWVPALAPGAVPRDCDLN